MAACRMDLIEPSMIFQSKGHQAPIFGKLIVNITKSIDNNNKVFMSL